MAKVEYENWEHARRTLYSEFEREVRKYEPQLLLTTLAHISADTDDFSGMKQEWRQRPPWAFSGIARQSILSSNRSDGLPITNNGMARMLNLYSKIEVETRERLNVHQLLVRTSFEQFPYQLSPKEDLSRVLAVLIDTPVRFKGMKTEADLDDLLGAPLSDVASSTFVLYSLAKSNQGTVTRTFIEHLASDMGSKLPSAKSILATLDRLSATIEEARADGFTVEQFKGGYQKYSYNPLTKTPFIRLNDDTYIAPQTFFILRSCSLESIYYLGMRKWPKQFGADLGHRIEAYTGRQLNHAGDLEVHPEVEWNGNKSIDWFVITPSVTILVECKSARATMDTRVGAATTAKSMSDKLRKGFDQIDKTVKEIGTQNPAFNHLPKDKPMLGLIVTAEPLYNANFTEVRAYLPESKVPILTISLRDLEGLLTRPKESLGDALLQIATDPALSTWDVSGAIRKILGDIPDDRRNCLIDEAYELHLVPRIAADRQLNNEDEPSRHGTMPALTAKWSGIGPTQLERDAYLQQSLTDGGSVLVSKA
jgi:hypothetical protein